MPQKRIAKIRRRTGRVASKLKQSVAAAICSSVLDSRGWQEAVRPTDPCTANKQEQHLTNGARISVGAARGHLSSPSSIRLELPDQIGQKS